MTQPRRMFGRALALSLVCLPFASCKKLPDAGSSTKGGEEGGACTRSIPDADQIALQAAVSEQIQSYVKGQSSVEQRDKKLEALVAKFGGGDAKRQNEAKMIVSQVGQGAYAESVTPIILKKLAGHAPTDEDNKLIGGLSLPVSVDAYLEHTTKALRPYYECLVKAGASVDEKGQWKLEGARINGDAIRKTPCLRAALAMFFSPELVSDKVLEGGEAIVIGENVIRPCKDYVVVSRKAWDDGVTNALAGFNREFAIYLKASGQSATYTEMMREAKPWWNTGSASAAKITKDGAYNAALKWREMLRCQGVAKTMLIDLNNMLMAGVKKDTQNIQAGLKKLALAEKAAVAALAVPVLIWALPYVGGAMLHGALTTSLAMTDMFAKIALMPMAFSMGFSVLNTAVDTAFHGGNFFCRLSENFAMAGAGALSTAPFAMAIPLASFGAGGLATVYTGSAAMGTNVYGLTNVATSLYFLGKSGTNAVSEVVECRNKLQQVMKVAEGARSESDVAIANTLLSDATKLCLQGGIDLGMAAHSTLEFIKTVAKIRKDVKEANDPDRAMCLAAESCDITNPKPRLDDRESVKRDLAEAMKKIVGMVDQKTNFQKDFVDSVFDARNLKTSPRPYNDAMQPDPLRGAGLVVQAADGVEITLRPLTTANGGFRGISGTVSVKGQFTAIGEIMDPAAGHQVQYVVDALNNAAVAKQMAAERSASYGRVKVTIDSPGEPSQRFRVPVVKEVVGELNRMFANPDAAGSGKLITKQLDVAPSADGVFKKWSADQQPYKNNTAHVGSYADGVIEIDYESQYWQLTDDPKMQGAPPTARFSYGIRSMFGSWFKTLSPTAKSVVQSAETNAKAFLDAHADVTSVKVEFKDVSEGSMQSILKNMGFQEVKKVAVGAPPNYEKVVSR